jgi:hypothetical protein
VHLPKRSTQRSSQFLKAVLSCPARQWQEPGEAYQALGKTAQAEADFKKYEGLTGQKP